MFKTIQFLIIPIFLILNFKSHGSILVASKYAKEKEFKSYVAKNNYTTFARYQIKNLDNRSDRTSEILNLSSTWLNMNYPIDSLDSDIRKLQTESPLLVEEKKLLFLIFEKKVNQPIDSISNRYYVNQMCWLFSNDLTIQYEFNSFKDYCQLNKVSIKKISKLFPNYQYLITDGTLMTLENNQFLSYNMVPQKITLVSNQKESINFFGTIPDLLKLKEDAYPDIVIGDCSNFKTKEIADIESYDVFFNANCVKNSKSKSFYERTSEFVKNNKYEILSGIIIIGLVSNYLRDNQVLIDTNLSLNPKAPGLKIFSF